MLDSILSAADASAVSAQNLAICIAASLILGLLAALTHMFRNTYTKSFVINLVLMPVIVQAVIFLVNGNLGAGVAVMGAFSLVRFRSLPGSAREIGSIFLVMAIGLANGMGYVGFAALFTVIYCGITLLLTVVKFGEAGANQRELKVTIPEDLDYTGIFDDLFAEFTQSAQLIRVRTTNMGSLYELCYHVTLRDVSREKAFIDEIRCRNGNLNIVSGRVAGGSTEL